MHRLGLKGSIYMGMINKIGKINKQILIIIIGIVKSNINHKNMYNQLKIIITMISTHKNTFI